MQSQVWSNSQNKGPALFYFNTDKSFYLNADVVLKFFISVMFVLLK